MSNPNRVIRAGAGGLLLTALLLYALNLRGPILTLAPVIDLITVGLNINTATAGLLAGIPVFCFALAAPLAALLMRKAGLETAVAVSLATVLIGTIIRSTDGTPAAFAGMAIIGLGITVGNVAVPVIIGRDFPTAVSTVTGMYAAALNVGSVLTTLGTAPIAAAIGWRWAIAGWGLLAVVALTVWTIATKKQRHGQDVPLVTSAPLEGKVWRRWDAWALMAAFGCQSFTYYGISAWLPTMLRDTQGLSAQSSGASAAIFQLFGIVGALVIPITLRRGLSTRTVSILMTSLWLVLPTGLLLAPSQYIIWMACAGIAQGGNFTVILSLMVQRSRSQTESRGMSAHVQGLGYVLGAAGPYVLGAVHTAANNWTAPLVVTLVALATMGLAGLLVASAGPYQPLRRSITV